MFCFCCKNCKFCKYTEKQNWNKVAQQIKHNTKIINQFYLRYHYPIDSSWLYNHKCVSYLYTNPIVNLSFPTSKYGQLGLKSKDSIYYFDLVFQLGKIYHYRERLKSRIRMLTKYDAYFIKTEESDYTSLSFFKAAKKKYNVQ